MEMTETSLVFKGIRPLQKLSDLARTLSLKNPLADILSGGDDAETLRTVPPDAWPGDGAHGRDMIAGVFRFAGQTISKDELSWAPEKASPEWLAELHGFEWLRNLRSVGGDRARRMAREMVSTWLEEFSVPHEIAWRPDVMGTRLKSWISFHDFFCASADDAFQRSFFDSLLKQTRYLARALPGRLSGLPLLRAWQGLAYTGIALDGGDRRLAQAFTAILKQVEEQILPDGGHISRNPETTFEFLRALVDIRAALISAKMDVPQVLQEAIDRMAPAVKFFRHGDGGLAQFNGAQEGNAHLIETTLMHSGARGRALQSMPNTGYERISQGRSSLIMDTGLPLAVSHSERAHAGLLSFEYCFGRDRVFVNCGTSATVGKWREILRSTLAHTTLIADHRNSCAIGDNGLISARPEVRARRQQDDRGTLIEANHNGYMPRFGLVHYRRVQFQEQGDVLFGEDQLSGKSGVPFAVRFHLHPAIEAETATDGDIVLRAKGGASWRFKSFNTKAALEESIYAAAGETPKPTKQITLTGQTTGVTTHARWELRRDTSSDKLL